MTDHQCPSCGGFCKKSGCERRDSIIPCKHFRSGLTNKTAADCPYCRIDELESQMQGLSNDINDFQNIIERQKSEIHELQCQQDTPLAFYEISHDEDGMNDLTKDCLWQGWQAAQAQAAAGPLGFQVRRAIKAEDELRALREQTYTTGHCKNHAQQGGCQLHNLQCGYPSCDRMLK